MAQRRSASVSGHASMLWLCGTALHSASMSPTTLGSTVLGPAPKSGLDAGDGRALSCMALVRDGGSAPKIP